MEPLLVCKLSSGHPSHQNIWVEVVTIKVILSNKNLDVILMAGMRVVAKLSEEGLAIFLSNLSDLGLHLHITDLNQDEMLTVFIPTGRDLILIQEERGGCGGEELTTGGQCIDFLSEGKFITNHIHQGAPLLLVVVNLTISLFHNLYHPYVK